MSGINLGSYSDKPDLLVGKSVSAKIKPQNTVESIKLFAKKDSIL